MDVTAVAALAAGAAWASGVNLYAAMLMIGILASTGSLTLPPDLQILTHPLVMTAAGFMYCIEFFADKTLGIDTGWDVLHTFVRIPAGATLAAAAVGEMDPGIQLAAFIIGGGLAASSHATKAGTRVIINTSPEPVTNWCASISEDLLVLAGLWVALNHPLVFLGLLVVFLIVVAWALPKIFRALQRTFAKVRAFIRGSPDTIEPDAATNAGSPPAALNAPDNPSA